MELYETELPVAKAKIAAVGRNPDDFSFTMEYLPPDPDGAGMFTVHYEVLVTDAASGKSASMIGGIGMGWVEQFEELLAEGHFN